MANYTHDALTGQVIAAVLEVSNTLGHGFLEKVYERALLIELNLRGIQAVAQTPLPVHYKNQTVGEYYADILVEGTLVLELKCADKLANEHMAQCLNYLRAANLHTCLLINFQNAKAEWKRIVL